MDGEHREVPDAPQGPGLEQLEPGINPRLNIGGLIAQAFIDNKTTFLVMVAAFIFGLFALFVTPREENPQISVPAVNVIVPFPGASPQEIENLVTSPLERLIWNIKGIEHVYSISYPDFAVVTAHAIGTFSLSMLSSPYSNVEETSFSANSDTYVVAYERSPVDVQNAYMGVSYDAGASWATASTMVGDAEPNTSLSHVASVTSMGSEWAPTRGAPHFPHLPRKLVLSWGTRFLVPQLEH